MAASIPDRSIIDEMAWIYLDAVYTTEGGKASDSVKKHALGKDTFGENDALKAHEE